MLMSWSCFRKELYAVVYDARHLLPTGCEEREVLVVGSIPVAILPFCQYMKVFHYNCIDVNSANSANR